MRTLQSGIIISRHNLQEATEGARYMTSLWPFAAAKCRGELRPPKVEYFARQGLQSRSILASTKSPSLAADTRRSPDAEHPNEFPILLPGYRDFFSAWNAAALQDKFLTLRKYSDGWFDQISPEMEIGGGGVMVEMCERHKKNKNLGEKLKLEQNELFLKGDFTFPFLSLFFTFYLLITVSGRLGVQLHYYFLITKKNIIISYIYLLLFSSTKDIMNILL